MLHLFREEALPGQHGLCLIATADGAAAGHLEFVYVARLSCLKIQDHDDTNTTHISSHIPT